jgi:hypothetical protein
MRFIGEDLTPRQVAALQTVANGAGSSMFCRVEKLNEVIDTHPDCRLLRGVGQIILDELFNALEKKGLIERRIINKKLHVGLTDDGKRCNLISVF